MFQSPTSAVGSPTQPGGLPQPREPVELVDVVWVVDLAAVGDVERPDPDAARHGPDGPRLGIDGVAPPRHPGEPDGDLLEADAADDGDAVPLVVADGRDVVAEGLEPHQRQLVLASLGLLDGEHVDLVALQEGLDAVDPERMS
jgi:hypothetical protein